MMKCPNCNGDNIYYSDKNPICNFEGEKIRPDVVIVCKDCYWGQAFFFGDNRTEKPMRVKTFSHYKKINKS